MWGLVLGFSLTYALLFLLVQGAGKLFGLSRETTKTLLVCGLFPNSGNMGLSLVYFALGEEGLRRAVVYFLLSSALMFGLGPAFIRGGGLKEGLLFTLRLPLFYALFLGLLLKALGLSLPFRLEEGCGSWARRPSPSSSSPWGCRWERPGSTSAPLRGRRAP